MTAIVMLGLGRATQASAERLSTAWHASVMVAESDGNVVRVREQTRDLLDACGDEQLPPLDGSELALVYDTAGDALEVVRARDGSVVCVPYRFVAGVTVRVGVGIRHALVIDASGRVIGSAVGPIDGPGQLPEWKAKISAGRTDAETGAAEIVEGVFRTGARFLPECSRQ